MLSGCGGDGDAAPGDGASSTTQSGLTAPGTALSLGDTATVPLDDDTDVIDLTVTSVDEGDPGDLKGLDGTPYYVRLEATAVTGGADQFFVESYLSAFSGDTRLLPIASPLTVGPCRRAYFGVGAEPGDRLRSCLTFVVEPDGAAVDRVAFGNEGDYPAGGDEDVEWGL